MRVIQAILLSLFLLGSIADAAKYYVDNAAANDNGTGAIGSPKKYIPSGIALMSASGGDTCIIKDGTYSGASNDITTFKAGTSGAWNTVMAENDGGAVVSAELSLSGTTSMYTKIIGMKFTIAATKAMYQRYLKFFRCAFANGEVCSSECNGAVNVAAGSYQLYEDCWFYGVGGRYSLMVYEETNVVVRRCVIRHESGSYVYDESNPEAPLANYGSANVSYQNCIVIDNNLTYSTGYASSYYCTGHDYNPASNNVAFIGCMDINGQGASWYIDTDDHSTGMSFTDCVTYNNDNGITMSNTGVALTFNRVTMGEMPNSGWSRGDNGSMTLTNCIAWNHTEVSGTLTTTYCNGYNPNSFSGTGVVHIDPEANGLLYLPRIEDGSTLKTNGSSSGQMGAQIMYKIGTSGTLYGETGYATTTAESLWPWPNEARIKSDMAAVPTIGARGFCTGNSMNGQAQSLTKYIWEQLGNQCPDFGGISLQWVGSTSSNPLTASNYNPEHVPTSIDTVVFNSGSADVTVGSKLTVAHFRQTSGYTGTITINDTVVASYIGIGTCAANFYAPCIVMDSIVYGASSTPVGYTGSKIVSVAGHTLLVRLNGKTSTPRVVLTTGSGSKIKWK